MKYCEFCGKEIKENAHCSCSEAVEQQNKRKNNIKKYGVIGGIIAVVVTVILLIAVAGSHTVTLVDPFQYTEVEFEGYETLGAVSVSFNREAFIEALIGEEPDTNNEDEIRKWYIKYETYSDAISYSYTPEEALSNGDTIEVRFTFGEVLQGKVAKSVENYTVSGLIEVEKVDIFKDITVTFEGLSGWGNAVITKSNDSEIVNTCDFYMENYGLSNGESFTMEIANVDELLETYAVVPLEKSKTYEVTGLNKFVTALEDIPVETIEEYAERFLKEQNDDEKDDFMNTYSDVKYYASYLEILKDDIFIIGKPDNRICIYVYYDHYVNGEYRATIYTPLVFENVEVTSNGELDVAYEDGYNATFTDSMEGYEESEIYNVYKIQWED